MKKITNNKLSPKVKKRIENARNSYKKIIEEIKPFIRNKKIKIYSTRGNWETI